jgi:hypothetical protein
MLIQSLEGEVRTHISKNNFLKVHIDKIESKLEDLYQKQNMKKEDAQTSPINKYIDT